VANLEIGDDDEVEQAAAPLKDTVYPEISRCVAVTL
jgi:hypothetical protein